MATAKVADVRTVTLSLTMEEAKDLRDILGQLYGSMKAVLDINNALKDEAEVPMFPYGVRLDTEHGHVYAKRITHGQDT